MLRAPRKMILSSRLTLDICHSLLETSGEHLERRKLEDRPSVKSDPVRWNFSLAPVLEKTSDQIADVRYTADASHTRKETAYDEERHGETAPLATPASRRPPHPASPGSTCCRAASPTRG